MSQRIIDIDAAGILTPPIQVKLKGETYTLPGDVPAPLYARLIATSESGGTPKDINGLYTELIALFQQYQPTLESLPVGVNEMVAVVGFIYNSAGDTGAEAGEDPTLPAKKTTSPRRARAKKSAS